MTAKPVKRDKVDATLAAAAKAFNEAHRGHHAFSPIWEVRDHPSCNWSSTYACRGSQISLSEMRAALQRVQEKYPIVTFD